ncbi:hypothetical protein GCM10027289_00350 [Tsukamurella serpentis]
MNHDFWPQEPRERTGTAEQYLAAHTRARALAAGLGLPGPSDLLIRAAELDTARTDLHTAYAQLVADTRQAMTGIAARTALARLDARAARPPGDPAAEAGADLAEQRGRAEAEDAAQQAQGRSADLAAAHGAGLAGMTPMGMLGRAIGGDGAHHAVRYQVGAPAPADLELRLRELCSAVTGPARGWVSMAIAAVTDDAGRPWRLIGTTELDGYLRPGVELRDGELTAGNEAWPELSIATFCAAHGFAPGPVVGGVEPPADVCEHLRACGFAPSWTTDAWDGSGDTGDAPLD